MCSTAKSTTFNSRVYDVLFLTLAFGNNHIRCNEEYGKVYDVFFPHPVMRLLGGSSVNIRDRLRTLGNGS